MSTKKIIIALSVIVVVLILIGLVKGKKSHGKKVAVEKAVLKDITEEVSASGKIYPEFEVKISPDVSGEITALFVEEGDTVKKGDLLLRINPEIYITQLDQAKASLNQAKANAANAEAQLDRVKANFELQKKLFERSTNLYKDKVISKQEFENAESAYLAGKAEYEATEKSVLGSKFNVQSVAASVEQAGKSYGRTNIYSPANGIVTGLNSKLGERVVGTAQMAGTEIMRVSDLGIMEVRVDVNENDIVRIKNGDSADISVDAYPGKKFKGVVTMVANSSKQQATGMTTDQVTNFEVKVRILPLGNEELNKLTQGRSPFRPGMSASVNIHTASEKQVLAIPVSSVALRMSMGDSGQNKQEKSEIVFVVSKGKAEMRKVKTGIQNTEFIRILEGIKLGEEVVFAPFELISFSLNDKDPVEVVKREELFREKE